MTLSQFFRGETTKLRGELANGVVLDVFRDGRELASEILGTSSICSGEVRRVLEVAKQIENETGSDS